METKQQKKPILNKFLLSGHKNIRFSSGYIMRSVSAQTGFLKEVQYEVAIKTSDHLHISKTARLILRDNKSLNNGDVINELGLFLVHQYI